MDIDMSALRGLVREKEISFDLLVEAIESALLIAYHRTEGSHRQARAELDRTTGHVTVWAKEDLEDLGFLDTLKKEFDGNAAFRKMAADPFVTTQPKVPVDSCGVFLCSLVKDMKINCPGVKTVGHAFEVPEFGRVYIGEVIAERCKRTVTMLRIQLGCSVVGGVTAAQTAGNGRTLP